MHALAAPPELIVELCRFLKEHPELRFDFLSDICGVDHHPATPRFEAVYHLYSLPNKWRVRIKCRLGDPPHIPSVTGVWRTANWHEREAWDMPASCSTATPTCAGSTCGRASRAFPSARTSRAGLQDELNPFGAEGPPPTRPDLATRNIP